MSVLRSLAAMCGFGSSELRVFRLKKDFRRIRRFLSERNPSYRFDWEVYTELLEGVLHAGVKWLDAGSGKNLWIDEYRDVGLGVGVDRVVHGKLRGNERFCVGDLYELPFRSGAFDLVTCRAVVEHLSDPLCAFAEFHRVLKREGVLLVQTTNRFAPLVLLANVLPWSWKRALIKALSGVCEEDIFPTHHRLNSPRAFKRGIPGFVTTRTILSENLFTFSRPVFYLHYLLYLFGRGFQVDKCYSTITGVLRKL